MTRMRIRSLKPELWRDEALAACSHSARMLFVGLITMADDAGRLRFTPGAIVGHVFPFDENVTGTKVRGWLNELASGGLIEFYEVDGRRYLWLPGWRGNQKINRPTPSKLPPPPDPAASWFPHDGLTEDSVNGSRPSHVEGREEAALSASPPARADRIGSDNNGANAPVEPTRLDAARERLQSADVTAVFDEWVKVTGRTGRTVLDDKRRRLIRKALAAYPLDDVLAAVRGWQNSPHHRGENERQTVYNELELLLRDGAHIERFRDLDRPTARPAARSERERLAEHNARQREREARAIAAADAAVRNGGDSA